MITKVLEAQLGDGPVPTDAANTKKVAKDDSLDGQLVEVKFPAKKPGKYNLQLICMSGLLFYPDIFVRILGNFPVNSCSVPDPHLMHVSVVLQAETLQVVQATCMVAWLE